MNFDEWNPVYEAILADFGFERSADERVRDRLAELVSPFDTGRLPEFDGSTVAVAGAGPSLSAETSVAREADVVVAASTAADVLRAHNVAVDLMVTDLDKNVGTAVDLSERGVPVAVHAHGDNGPAVRSFVPSFDPDFLLPTTQAKPAGPVRNFGGFTDGDRGAFLADHFGAAELRFPGWDFDDDAVDPVKSKKLDWAERLLRWLERRREERFDVLDGRRDGIDPVPE
ncbi:6-hydroxymethylpterin diphosphokinase MptE-like protein [Halostella sp. PRR32]|uniref:6-hydroxymethylpterin diphosphokinase MptE-like protein n=1 Tax=Halostella sp. PRR32 TaxID=3098147 RepID=UPI002B1D80F0|nr:6-hydroxymethylpterin diphosphokinase MptE-like protein [Halostella sp. PRR32]